VRAIDGEAILLPVLIEEEQEHEQVSQNDRDYGNHSHIPHLAAVAHLGARLGYWVAGCFERPRFRPLSPFNIVITTVRRAAEGMRSSQSGSKR
jgi:hypothetical protein